MSVDLDDRGALAAADPDHMFAAVASAGEQIREALADVERAGLTSGATPRTLIVAGMGGSAAAGDVLAALAAGGAGAQLPVLVHRGVGLPAWVGPDDLVIGLSCSGRTEETLDAVGTALERGARLITIGGTDSPLADLAAGAGVAHLDVDAGGRQPRASLWSLAAPLLLAADSVGVGGITAKALESAATVLDGVAAVCRPEIETGANPAKQLALHLNGGLALLWGTPGVGATVANRFGCQIAENAKLPSVVGALSEAHHNQIVAFDGLCARGEEPGGLRLVVLADEAEPERLERRITESMRAAQDVALPAVALRGSGPDPLSSLAGLVALIDFASVYLAALAGVDPTPVAPIDALKQRMSEDQT